MARFTKGLDLYNHQRERFKKVQQTAAEMHMDISKEGLKDWYELVSGDGQPAGRARRKWLKALGYPFGRRGLAAVLAEANRSVSGQGLKDLKRAAGRRREITKEARQATGFKGHVPLLPVGMISGRLRRAVRLKKQSLKPQKIDVGPRGAGDSAWVLVKGGTRKAVARGVDREIRRRWRPRNKALLDELRERNKDP